MSKVQKNEDTTGNFGTYAFIVFYIGAIIFALGAVVYAVAIMPFQDAHFAKWFEGPHEIASMITVIADESEPGEIDGAFFLGIGAIDGHTAKTTKREFVKLTWKNQNGAYVTVYLNPTQVRVKLSDSSQLPMVQFHLSRHFEAQCRFANTDINEFFDNFVDYITVTCSPNTWPDKNKLPTV